AALHLRRPLPRIDDGLPYRLDLLPRADARARARRPARTRLAELLSLLPLGGLARGPAQDFGALGAAAIEGLGRGRVGPCTARTPAEGRRQLRPRRLERGACAAALRAALRGGPGAGSGPAAQARRRSGAR